MPIVRRVLLVVSVLALCVFAWLWWTRPVKVDMATYVPADSIVYLEANSLPEIFGAVTSTDDWRELAAAAGVEAGPGAGGWLARLVSFTGVGPSDSVVLSRAQVAVAVLGFDAAEEPDAALKYTPRAALVAETHTSEWRAKAAVEKLVGDFARRTLLGADGALAFGFAPQGSAAKVVEVFAPAFVGGVTEDVHIQSLLATLLPQLTNRVVGSAGWTSRVAGGRVEDDYFLSLPGEMSERLQAPLAPGAGEGTSAADFLPPDVYQFTRYEFRSPEAAWRGLNAALSSQVDVTMAIGVTRALDGLLRPYGIEQPRDFLRACGPEVGTARLEEGSEGKVLVTRARDRAALAEQVRAYLRRDARAERVGDADIIVSKDPERGAAAFVGDYLLLGPEGDVRRCVAAHLEGRTLKGAVAFKAAAQNFFDAPPFALTLTDDRDPARSTLSYFARRADARPAQSGRAALEEALARRAYSVGETRLADGGFEKRTRSAFGLFGEIVT